MKETLSTLFQYKTLTRTEAAEVLRKIATSQFNDTQIAVFLAVFLMRSITIEELSGFREALKELALEIDLGDYRTIDLCGTGGDNKNTFNISTLSSFVVAASGEKVAKHGNYGVSSACGSSNVLEHFGYRFSNDQDKLRRELEEAGICFLHAPLFNPAMKNVAPVRKQLGIKTFFNILGPMINPSSPKAQLIGVFSLELARMYNYMYQQLAVDYTIVHSLDGYDEVSLTGPFKIVTRQGEQILEPADIGMPTLTPEQIYGGNTVEESAAIFQQVISGNGTPAQNSVVIANSGLALKTLFPEQSLDQCFEIAGEALKSGKALRAFKTLIKINE
ncbi:MAG: anthranilate phosphoribosyltransferase [Bacteroidetes bacterium GWF2_49_14]|nr:MAG: anthranilate phosphoribosyltransferase [Bacteroidetes bacterium GWF2_49_14]HBB90290.1 anthranilate phosphoribosyltransferase [Bacteroidales bacterium]